MDSLQENVASKPFALVGTFAALSVLYFAGRVIYQLYVHPLHHVPGPKINAISRIPYVRHLLSGTTADNVQRLHEKYGEVVRISPNEVSFISGETAWTDIYGFRTGKLKGHENMQKDPAWYAPPPQDMHIILADDQDHSRFRRVYSHAFSDKALHGQEALLQGYVDQLVSRLKEVTAKNTKPQDMTEWYNWTTFDIIADLLFGEPFGCLQDLATHRYIKLLFSSLTGFRMFYVMYYFPLTKYLRGMIIDRAQINSRMEYYKWVATQTTKRMQRETQRPDFMTEVLKHNGEKGVALSEGEMKSNSAVLLTAGSETTATLLSGATWALLKNPEVYQKLKTEIRSRFSNYHDITLEQVNNAPYLLAVLNEALRYFPPVPTGFERRVGKGGEVVSGYFMPENTSLCVSSWGVGRSERNFKDPKAFIPERWIGDARFASDKRDSHQPFSFGPRNCLGKNLAYAEMRLIVAKIVWSFDMELDAKSADWMQRCRVKTLWEKPELLVHVREVGRG